MATDGKQTFDDSGLMTLRGQTAFLRSLVDELERLPPTLPRDEVGLQIIEELRWLASRCSDVARSLSVTFGSGQ